jgi:hypothetical protein
MRRTWTDKSEPAQAAKMTRGEDVQKTNESELAQAAKMTKGKDAKKTNESELAQASCKDVQG